MDYAYELEKQLCPLPELLERMLIIRAKVRENRLNRIVSTRFLKEAYDMIAQWGWTVSQVEEQLFQGWRADEIAKVR